ncbi:MAG: zinc ABC transporter substrate-binding protein [Burkholderiaceae bacterium]
MLRLALVATLTLSALAPVRAAAPPAKPPPPVVVASIKPLHAIVAAVMKGIAEPALLLDGAFSPHAFALKPSQMRLLQEADLVVWVGPGLEAPLVRALEARDQARPMIQMNALNGLTRLPLRVGGNFEGHADEHDDGHDGHAEKAGDGGHDAHPDVEHAHEPAAMDPHTWLDPRNAIVLAEAVGQRLQALDPARADRVEANVRALVAQLQALETSIRAQMAGLENRPFMVFHDAYQYFEHRFGIAARAAVTISAEREPGAKRVGELRALVEREGIRCVFTEPQHRPAVVRVIVTGTRATLGALDPVGAAEAAGADFYPKLMRNLANDLAQCLAASR